MIDVSLNDDDDGGVGSEMTTSGDTMLPTSSIGRTTDTLARTPYTPLVKLIDFNSLA